MKDFPVQVNRTDVFRCKAVWGVFAAAYLLKPLITYTKVGGMSGPPTLVQPYRPKTFSKPTTSPDCFTTSRMQRTTPGM